MSELTKPSHERKRGKLRLFIFIAIVPLVVCTICGLVLSIPQDPTPALEAVTAVQSGLDERISGIDASNVEAYAIDRTGATVNIGLLLSTVQVDRMTGSLANFDAELFNLGDFPLEKPWVQLRLYDVSGEIVDTVDLVGNTQTLAPGEGVNLHGTYNAELAKPQIVEETISIGPDEFFSFTSYSYDQPKDAPGFLGRMSEFFPLLTYKTVRTNPNEEWETFLVQFRVERVIQD